MRALVLLFAFAACGDSRAMPDGNPGEGETEIDAATDADTDVDAMVDAPAGCGTLAPDPTDVFVDIASTQQSVGTAACPFHAIDEALALAAPAAARTIHVAAGAYVETAIVAIPPKVTLDGAGEAMVTISGGGTCAITASPCTVTVAGGATLRNVTVTNATGDAIVVTGGTGTASIDHATASNAKRFGITVRASVLLDHVTSSNNKSDGLNAKMATVTITNSTFNNNTDNGLDIDQGATLAFAGGMLTGNQGDALFLHSGLSHDLSNLSILQNLGFGIYCVSSSSCKVRGTTMFGNEVGNVFIVGTGTLDIGTTASAGNNKLAGPGVTDKNIRAGLCFEQSGAAQTQLVEGNTWRVCPPPAKKIGPFCRSNNTYSDIAFVPAVTTSGSPVVPPAACTASP